MLLFKSKYIKDLHNFVNCKMCYIFTLTPPPIRKKNPVCATGCSFIVPKHGAQEIVIRIAYFSRPARLAGVNRINIKCSTRRTRGSKGWRLRARVELTS
jgi:hypothetical protein